MEHELDPRASMLGNQRDCLARDPAVDGLDQAGPLGTVEKGAGRERLTLLLLEPQQQLVLADLIRAEVEDGLTVGDQAIFFERLTDSLRFDKPPRHALSTAFERSIHDESIPAGV